MWDYTGYALEFFQKIPFWEMESYDEFISDKRSFCLAKSGEIYAVYLPDINKPKIDLSDVEGDFEIGWYNPREGGNMQDGTIRNVRGGGMIDMGSPITDTELDWVALLKKN